MEHPTLLNKPLSLSFIFIIIIISTPTSHGTDGDKYRTCHEKTYDCGEQIKEIGYPFWGKDRPQFCGVQGFELTCHSNENTTIVIEKQAFRVLHINQSAHNMTIARADLWDNLCPKELSDTTLNFTLFDYAPYPHVLNLTLFHDCLPEPASYDQIQERSHFQCPEVAGSQSSSNISFFVEEPYPYDWYIPECKSRIKVPVFQEALYAFWGDKHMTVEELVKQGFEADYHEMGKFHACDLCNASGGECGTDTTTNQAICFFQVQQAGVKGKKGKKREVVVVTLALLIGLLLLGMSVTLYLQKQKRKNSQLNKDGNLMNLEQGYTDKDQKEDLKLPLFDLAIIAHSTSNFSINNKLGEGGFGPVYKGMLEGGEEIAVKRLSKSSSQGLDEFKNEVICIAKLQHRNLVKLLGCCIQGEEKMLIYEYMPNKSLDYFIFDQTRSMLLDWPKRFHIINGISRGLLYLHRDSRLRIIHRDLKASNILLDIDMNPKISDFGMARSFRGNETEANTNKVVGTYGYMSPEYVVDGLFSIKSDVFSFGVLVLEIVSGKKNRGFYHPDHHLNLLGHAWRLYKEDRSLELIDEALWDSCYLTEVLRSIHVGLLCVQQSPEDRPSMSSVVLMLGGEGGLPQAKQPGFFTERNVLEAASSSSKVATASANEMTITLLNAR